MNGNIGPLAQSSASLHTAGMEPTVGRIVHYVSHGSPVRADGTQAYESVCRAAIVTEVEDVEGYYRSQGVLPTKVGLCVLNPTGQFFSTGVEQYEATHEGGTWHWPERA